MKRKPSMKWIFPLLVVLTVWISLAVRCPDGMATGTYCNPYSMAQVKKMMRFHGTLCAKFDGQTWRYKSEGKWLRLDNEQAKQRCI